MTEAEWLTATDPTSMVEFVRGQTSDRKLRLFAVACGRRLGDHLTEADRHVINFVERYADNLADRAERRAIATSQTIVSEMKYATALSMSELVRQPGISVASWFAQLLADRIARLTIPFPNADGSVAYMRQVERIFQSALWRDAVRTEQSHQRHLVADIFGNLFRPIGPFSSWLTSDVLPLAESIYQERTFDRMPILADALDDAGCANADILTHCRGDGPHVRGCWVVDLLLGKD